METSTRKLPILALIAILGIVLLGAAAWYWYAYETPPATHAGFYGILSERNASFAKAEEHASHLRFAEALPLYQAALQSATNEDQRIQIRFLIARMMVQTKDFMQAVPLLKEIVNAENTPRFARVRALAVEEIAGLYARSDDAVNAEIFKDEPFKSLLTDRTDLTLQKLHEFAASIDPLAISNLWMAQWHTFQLPDAGKQSKFSIATVEEYKAKIQEYLAAADRDIASMQQEGTMGADLRFAILMKAIDIGMLVRKGDTSFGDPIPLFADALAAYQVLGPGYDCIPRYHHALFLAQTYGAEKKADIQAILKPLSAEAYTSSNACIFLSRARSGTYVRQFPILIANIDPDFKAFLMTIGWTAVDFSS